MPCRNRNGSYLKKALLAAAVAAFIQMPADLNARVLSGSITERKQNRKIESMLKSARKSYDSGKVQPAIDSYWKILELDPNETFAYLELGEVYVNLRIFDRAVELLEPGLNMAQREMDHDTICYYYCILTNAHLGLNQIGLANKTLIKAAEASPKNPMPRKVMGDIYLANDRIADAMKAYRKAVDLDPAYQPAVEKLGELVAKYGDQPPAKSADKSVIKEKAVKLPPSEARPQITKKAELAQPAADNSRPKPEPVASAKPAPEAKPVTQAVDETPIALPATTAMTTERPMPLSEPAAKKIDQPVGPRPVPVASNTAAEKPETAEKPAPKPVADINPGIKKPETASATTGTSPAAANSVVADASEIEGQLDKLLAGTAEEKSAAVSFFVKLEEKGLTEIEELLYDPDPEVRSLAVRTLPEFKAFNQRVKTMLQDASEDPDPMVLEEINKALENLNKL